MKRTHKCNLQCNCKQWFQQLAGRITASRFREVLHTDCSQPLLSLIKSVCHPAEHQFATVPYQYWLDNEEKVRSVYFERFVERHDSLMIIKSGLILNSLYLFMGATPQMELYIVVVAVLVPLKSNAHHLKMLPMNTIQRFVCTRMKMVQCI